GQRNGRHLLRRRDSQHFWAEIEPLAASTGIAEMMMKPPFCLAVSGDLADHHKDLVIAALQLAQTRTNILGSADFDGAILSGSNEIRGHQAAFSSRKPVGSATPFSLARAAIFGRYRQPIPFARAYQFVTTFGAMPQ